jgi:hypothetical protein
MLLYFRETGVEFRTDRKPIAVNIDEDELYFAGSPLHSWAGGGGFPLAEDESIKKSSSGKWFI